MYVKIYNNSTEAAMDKSAKFRLIYSIFLSVFTVAVGIALICVAADIYYSGKGTGVIYTREIVGDRLLQLAIPLIFWIAAVIFGAIFPLYKVKAKMPPEDALKKLQTRVPTSGDGESFAAAQAAYKKAEIIRLVSWTAAMAVVLAAAIAILCYVANTAHFPANDPTEDIFAMTKNVLPWLAAAFAASVGASVVSWDCATQQIESAKTMIKDGDKSAPKMQSSEPKFLSVVKAFFDKPIVIWVIRGIVLVIAITFIIVGIVNGGAHDVLVKAINICQECIGLG